MSYTGLMEGFWPIFFLVVVLKIPAIGMIWLLYWAATNDSGEGVLDEGEGGGGRRRPRPLRPRGPRRDPHGGGAMLPSPPRSRPVTAAIGRRESDVAHRGDPSRAREREPGRS